MEKNLVRLNSDTKQRLMKNLSHLSLHMPGVLGALTTNLPMLDRLRIRKLPSEWSRIR